MAHAPSTPPPQLKAYWFYTSSQAIDDPLSPLPTTAAQNARQPPRPFSKYDSSALEGAYQELLRENRSRGPNRAERYAPKSTSRSQSPKPHEHRVKRSESSRSREAALEGHPVFNVEDDGLQLRDEISTFASTAPTQGSMLERRSTIVSGGRLGSLFAPSSAPSNTSTYTAGAETTAANTTPTRNPFIRSLSLSRNSTMPHQQSSASSSRRSSITGRKPPPSPSTPPPPQKEIPVGIQRLHKVLLPSLVMAPIYWSPLHDVSSVVRGTWFYKDTMLPVEAEMANRLEVGWEEVRAWTEEWEMELSSAVEVGREGEEKVRWQLWDASSISVPNSRPGSSGVMESQSLAPVTSKTTPGSSANEPPRVKPNEWDWVLFANDRDAYICRDSTLSFGQKRPLSNIRRGKTVGTHVVRGFSEAEWLKRHPLRRKSQPAATPARNRYVAEKKNITTNNPRRTPVVDSEFQAGGNVGGFSQHQEEGLGLGENDWQRGKVTDLFLVIHG